MFCLLLIDFIYTVQVLDGSPIFVFFINRKKLENWVNFQQKISRQIKVFYIQYWNDGNWRWKLALDKEILF
jgi:hypothetical protein